MSGLMNPHLTHSIPIPLYSGHTCLPRPCKGGMQASRYAGMYATQRRASTGKAQCACAKASATVARGHLSWISAFCQQRKKHWVRCDRLGVHCVDHPLQRQQSLSEHGRNLALVFACNSIAHAALSQSQQREVQGSTHLNLQHRVLTPVSEGLVAELEKMVRHRPGILMEPLHQGIKQVQDLPDKPPHST